MLEPPLAARFCEESRDKSHGALAGATVFPLQLPTYENRKTIAGNGRGGVGPQILRLQALVSLKVTDVNQKKTAERISDWRYLFQPPTLKPILAKQLGPQVTLAAVGPYNKEKREVQELQIREDHTAPLLQAHAHTTLTNSRAQVEAADNWRTQTLVPELAGAAMLTHMLLAVDI